MIMLWYSLEAPWQGASNEYHNIHFQVEINRTTVLPFLVEIVPYLELCIGVHFCCLKLGYGIYPKYLDTSTPYHTCSKILTSRIYYPDIMSKICWMSGKQCRL